MTDANVVLGYINPRAIAGGGVPIDADLVASRISIAFFHQANYDALIECLPTCCGRDNPPNEPVRAAQHRLQKFMAGFGSLP